MSFEELAKKATDFQSQANDVGRISDAGRSLYDPDKLVENAGDSLQTDEAGFDPDKVNDVETAEDSGTPEALNSDGDIYDPDKPIEPESRDNTEVSNRVLDSQDGDPEPAKVREDKESLWEEIKNLWSDYIDDLLAKSEYSETIDQESLSVVTPEKVDSEKVSELRDEFDKVREKLIEEWEKANGTEWPRYQEDVYLTKKNGEVYLKHPAGTRYDAHHVVPLSMGGKNEVSNITPIHVKDHDDHKGVHDKNGAYGKLANAIKEM